MVCAVSFAMRSTSTTSTFRAHSALCLTDRRAPLNPSSFSFRCQIGAQKKAQPMMWFSFSLQVPPPKSSPPKRKELPPPSVSVHRQLCTEKVCVAHSYFPSERCWTNACLFGSSIGTHWNSQRHSKGQSGQMVSSENTERQIGR